MRKVLEDYRGTLGISKKEMADKVGFNRGDYTQYLNGKKCITDKVARKMLSDLPESVVYL